MVMITASAQTSSSLSPADRRGKKSVSLDVDLAATDEDCSVMDSLQIRVKFYRSLRMSLTEKARPRSRLVQITKSLGQS